jgi:hypothetical protein
MTKQTNDDHSAIGFKWMGDKKQRLNRPWPPRDDLMVRLKRGNLKPVFQALVTVLILLLLFLHKPPCYDPYLPTPLYEVQSNSIQVETACRVVGEEGCGVYLVGFEKTAIIDR